MAEASKRGEAHVIPLKYEGRAVCPARPEKHPVDCHINSASNVGQFSRSDNLHCRRHQRKMAQCNTYRLIRDYRVRSSITL
jgi:hypothetical protein